MHDKGVRKLNEHFRTTDDFYKNVKYDPELIKTLKTRYHGDRRAFFSSGPDSREFKERIDLFDFVSFDEGYHQLMSELCEMTIESIRLILPENDDIENIYITGGFGKNKIFLKLLAKSFPSKKVFTSVINDATALGAAIVILKSVSDKEPELNLGLTEYSA
jgi:sugar (pentulose or hexulose) kinase